MDVLILILAVAILLNSKIVYENNEYLSIQQTKMIKGIMAITVMYHHISIWVQQGVIFPQYIQAGYLAVGVFLFFTGYGLMKQYQEKGSAYLRGFLKKRICPILLIYLFFTMLYWFVKTYFFVTDRTLIDMLKEGVRSGNFIADNSWYIITIILIYFVFYLGGHISERGGNTIAIDVISLIFTIIYIFLCIKLEYGVWWYTAIFCYNIGLLYARIEKRILNRIEIWIFGLLCIVTLCLAAFNHLHYGFLVSNCKAIMFVLLVLFASRKIVLGSVVLEKIGGGSLEIYLVHGLFICAFRSDRLNIQDDYVYVCLVIVCSIICAYIIHKIYVNCVKLLHKEKR